MKTRTLTAERLRELLVYDPETGVFTKSGTPVGTRTHQGYLEVWVDGVKHSAHRLAFLWMTGAWPRNVVDHINRIREDNRWFNLRDVTQAANSANRPPSKYGLPRGVQRKGLRFQARLKSGSQEIYLGLYATPEEAHAAYLAACVQLHHQGEPPSVNQSSSA